MDVLWLDRLSGQGHTGYHWWCDACVSLQGGRCSSIRWLWAAAWVDHINIGLAYICVACSDGSSSYAVMTVLLSEVLANWSS